MSWGVVFIKSKYKLANFFTVESFKKTVERWGFPIQQSYPELEQILKNYQFKYKHAIRAPIPLAFGQRGQVYSAQVALNEQHSYQVIWSVVAANRVIEKVNLPIVTVTLAEIVARVDQEGIRVNYLPKALKNDRPIILANYPQLREEPKLFIIDGNHRVIGRFKESIAKIPAYVLTPEQHLKAMTRERYRVLYKIHFNCLMIVRCMGGQVSYQEASSNLYQL
jgi:hypothetical protein